MAKIKLAQQVGRIGREHVVELGEEDEVRASELHRDAIVFDLHLHGVVIPEEASQFREWGYTRRFELGYEGLKHARLTAFISGLGMGHAWRMEDVIRELGYQWCAIDHHQDQVIRAFRAEDVLRAKVEGKIAVFFCVEGADFIASELDNLDMLYGLGIRALGLTYNRRNLVADGRVERTDCGLSNFGFSAIARMNALGIIVDAAHAGVRATLEAVEASRHPIVVSHAGARAVFPTARMSTDEEMLAVASKGGLIGIHSGPNILSDAPRQGIEDMMRHLDYCVKLVGADHVAIGSDNYFGDKNAMHAHDIEYAVADGLQKYLAFNAPYMEGMENPSEWPNITRALVKRGYCDEDIRKLIGGNTLRLVRQVVG